MQNNAWKRLLALTTAAVLSLSGCQKAPPAPTASPLAAEEHRDNTFFAMDTVMSFTVYGPHAEEALAAATDRVNSLERLLSVTLEDSEVWKLNHAEGESVRISPETNALLRSARELGETTGGALDITMYPVLKTWGFTTGDYRVPSGDELEKALALVDYRAVQVEPDETGPADATLPAGMEVDFGALAKGYAGELCAGMLRGMGVTSAILRLSGNIQTVGAKPDGSAWRIGIQNPNGNANDNVGILEIIDQAAVTSGGYQRFFEADGVRYWHIIDPATGAPARSGLTSVTIVADSGTLCDGLSTALFVMGLDKGLGYWRAHRDFECILMDEEQNIWITPGLADAFTLVDGSGYTLHIVEE